MCWLLFIDESGHDHKSLPYEVTGGIALHADKVGDFVRRVQAAERRFFGVRLTDVGSEIKGSKLLKAQRFRWAREGPEMDPSQRRKLARKFLSETRQGGQPARDQFIAYGQASLPSSTSCSQS